MRAHDTIMCKVFPTILCLATRDWYVTLKPNSIGSFKEFAGKFISHFAFNHKPNKIIVSLLEMQ